VSQTEEIMLCYGTFCWGFISHSMLKEKWLYVP